MLSSAAGPTDVPLLETTIGADLERTVARHGEREALVECATGRRWTYAELDRDVDRLARALLAAGLEQGERVGILAPNCAEWVLVQYATAKVGVVLVTVNPAYRTSELAYVLRQSGVRLLVSATAFKGSDYRAMVDEVRPDCPALTRTVFIGTPDWDDLLATSADEAALRERSAPAFDPAVTLRAVQDERCTALYGVPTMFIAMQGLRDFGSYDLSSLRTGIMAGSPCPVTVMERCIRDMHMAEVSIAYGMTETSPVSTQTRVEDDVERRTSTVGRVHPHVEVKVVDPVDGETVPRGETGELCTRGYSVMLGYWDEPEKTAEAVDGDGWMHTGDLAVMREDGYVNIVGRSKDMVIRGGENVYPREVEEFLHTHPDVADVQVVGVPDPRYGEELCAWVKLREGADPLTVEAVRAFCAGRLAHYKVPRYVRVVDDFPMTVTGKVRKVEMRERSVAELGLQAAAPHA